MGEAAVALGQIEAGVVQLDDAGDQTVDADGHHQGDADQHQHLGGEAGFGDGTEGDGDDFRGEDEVGTDRAADLLLFQGSHVDIGRQRCLVGVLVVMGQVLVGDLLEALEAQVGAAEHQQRDHRPGREGADQQGGGNEDRLVPQRALGHRPDHRQFAVGVDPGDLLGVQRQVVAENAGGLLRGDLGHQRDVVEHRGDIVEEGEEAGSGHVWVSLLVGGARRLFDNGTVSANREPSIPGIGDPLRWFRSRPVGG